MGGTSHDSDARVGVGVPEPVVSAAGPVMAGRLRARLHVWQRMFPNNKLVLSWVEHGVLVPFAGEAPAAHHRASTIRGADELRFTREQIGSLLARKVIQRGRPKVCCPLGVVPKKGPKRFRLIHNVRYVNAHLARLPFKYESITDLQYLLKPGEWMVKFDLEAGYHHIPLHPSQWELYGFEFEGEQYMWRQLFFGLSPACYVFTVVLRALCARWRARGIRLVHYIDDILVVGPRNLVREQGLLVRAELEALGFLMNMAKSVVEPVQQVDFLGFDVDSRGEPRLTVPTARVDKLRAALLELQAAGLAPVPVRSVARVAGQIMSMSLALAPARLFTRELYRVIDSMHRQDLPDGWRARVHIHALAREEIDFWLRCFDRWNGLPIGRTAGVVEVQVTSDASHLHGWGGWIENPAVRLQLPLEAGVVRTFNAQGRWTVLTADEHINLQELRGWYFTARALRSEIPRGSRVRPRLDNTTAIAYINNGGGRLPLFTAVVRDIWHLAVEEGWLMQPAIHIRGEHNVLADYLSRNFDQSDWMFNPKYFEELDALWGPHTYDRSASYVNHQNNLPYDSLYYDPFATGHDTFTQRWGGHNNWCNGNFAILSRYIAHARDCAARVTFIVPRWPREWWHVLCAECVAWRELPRAHDLFLPGDRHSAFPGGRPPWRVYAFRVDFRQTADSLALRKLAHALPWSARRM